MASGAARIVTSAAGASFRVGRAMLRPERLEMMAETGSYLRDMRELGGLTLMELSEALDLEDKSFLEAVENGTATLSFELILRMAALVARHDPVPFVMQLTRTYNPSIWRILNDWGVGRVTLQMERERQFVSLLRRHDGARKLSDEGFAKVLAVAESAFEMALFYALKEEGIEDKLIPDEELAKQNS
jgi:transcriptional regulator with XRE-family HTH domain